MLETLAAKVAPNVLVRLVNTAEFTLEEQIGGQLEAGFILTNLYEDTNGIGRLHELNIPSFFATRAIK